MHTTHTKTHTHLLTHRFLSSSRERWSKPTDIVLTTFKFEPAAILIERHTHTHTHIHTNRH